MVRSAISSKVDVMAVVRSTVDASRESWGFMLACTTDRLSTKQV